MKVKEAAGKVVDVKVFQNMPRQSHLDAWQHDKDDDHDAHDDDHGEN